MAAAPKKRFRETLQDLWTQHSTEIESALLAAIKQDKAVRAKCQCGRNFDVQAPDHTARINAIRVWAEHGFGRPATDNQPTGDNIKLDQLDSASEDELMAAAHAGADE